MCISGNMFTSKCHRHHFLFHSVTVPINNKFNFHAFSIWAIKFSLFISFKKYFFNAEYVKLIKSYDVATLNSCTSLLSETETLILFGTTKCLTKSNKPKSVSYRKSAVRQVPVYKYLGVEINSTLSHNSQSDATFN